MEITTYIWIKYYKKIQVLFYDEEFDNNPNLNKDEIWWFSTGEIDIYFDRYNFFFNFLRKETI